MDDIDVGTTPVTEKKKKVLKHAGYGICSFVLSAVMVVALIIFAFNAAIIKMTSPDRLLEIVPVIKQMNRFGTSASVVSVLGLVLGGVGLLQKNRSKIFSVFGLVLNLVILQVAVLCVVLSNWKV